MFILTLSLSLAPSLGLFYYASEYSHPTSSIVSTCQLYGLNGLSASLTRYSDLTTPSLASPWRLTSLTCVYRTYPARDRRFEAELTETNPSFTCSDLLRYSASSIRSVAFRKYLSLCTPLYDVSLATNFFFNSATRLGVPALDRRASSSVFAFALLANAAPSVYPPLIYSDTAISLRRCEVRTAEGATAEIYINDRGGVVLEELRCPGRVFQREEALELASHSGEGMGCEYHAAMVDLRLLCRVLDDLHQVAVHREVTGNERCELRNGEAGDLGVRLTMERGRRGWRVRELSCNSEDPDLSLNNRFAVLGDRDMSDIFSKLHKIEVGFNRAVAASDRKAAADGRMSGESICELLRMSEYSGISFNNLCSSD